MHRGFTLIEVLIALAISGILMTGVYAAFKSQQDIYLAQDQVAEMQQSIRAALYVMVNEVRMAGYTGEGDSNAGIVDAEIDAISFTLDLNENGDTSDPGENIGYDQYDSGTTGPDTLGRGSSPSEITLVESPSGSGHYECSTHQPFVPNIEKIEFYYVLEDGSATSSPASVDLEKIRAIRITLLAKADKPDRNYTDSKIYPAVGTTPSGAVWGPFNDNFRRRYQTLTVNLRNMGL